MTLARDRKNWIFEKVASGKVESLGEAKLFALNCENCVSYSILPDGVAFKYKDDSILIIDDENYCYCDDEERLSVLNFEE